MSIFNTLSPYITVFSGLNDINKYYAPTELASLFTNNIDQMFGDDELNISDIKDSEVFDQNTQDNMLLGNVSKVFHISVWATTSNGANAGLEVDVDTTRIDNKHFSIISWQESSQS